MIVASWMHPEEEEQQQEWMAVKQQHQHRPLQSRTKQCVFGNLWHCWIYKFRKSQHMFVCPLRQEVGDLCRPTKDLLFFWRTPPSKWWSLRIRITLCPVLRDFRHESVKRRIEFIIGDKEALPSFVCLRVYVYGASCSVVLNLHFVLPLVMVIYR